MSVGTNSSLMGTHAYSCKAWMLAVTHHSMSAQIDGLSGDAPRDANLSEMVKQRTQNESSSASSEVKCVVRIIYEDAGCTMRWYAPEFKQYRPLCYRWSIEHRLMWCAANEWSLQWGFAIEIWWTTRGPASHCVQNTCETGDYLTSYMTFESILKGSVQWLRN